MFRLAPVLLCVVVLGAGCAGFAADDRATPGPVSVPDVTVPTPAATPTATARPRVAHGLTRERVVDPEALVAAHVRRLRNASFLVTYERTVTDANGTVRRRVIDGRVDDGGDATTTWTTLNVSGTLGRDTTEAENRPPSPFFRARLVPVLSAVSLHRTADPDGLSPRSTTYHFRGTAERARLFGERVRNVSVRLEVESSGIVMSYRVRYERAGTGEVVTETLYYGAVWFERD
ncbi:MAG: hypothetical protein ABEJ94_13010 [Halorientalis sp.]